MTHAISSVFTHAVGSDDAVWDAGHAVMPRVPGLWRAVEAATLLLPALVLLGVPRRARRAVSYRAAKLHLSLIALRSLTTLLTVLPPLMDVPPLSWTSFAVGHGRDYIFSGHAAFVASWCLSCSSYVAPALWAIPAGLHALGLVATRMHYSIDVVLAWVLAGLLRHAGPTTTRLSLATEAVRQDIYRARHEIYSEELGQYAPTPTGTLQDFTDDYNTYIAVHMDGALQGFVAITPPTHRKAMEKHGVVPVDSASYELRLLSVVRGSRRLGLGMTLCHAASRFVDACGGVRVEAMARMELLATYEAYGFRRVSATVVSVGCVGYAHVIADVADLCTHVAVRKYIWDLPFESRQPKPCVHGGRGLEMLCPDPDAISADVLDAWFPPAPDVMRAMADEVAVRTTPPTGSCELLQALSRARGVDAKCLVLGAGSSDLIYRAFFAWLTPASRVLLLTPSYAEYEHILEEIGCHVTRVRVGADTGYCPTPDMMPRESFDLAILVNPNSPTGVAFDSRAILAHIRATRVWVDETYVDYVGSEASLETDVMSLPNVVVCKSMSKAYALSGVRVGYLCAHPIQLGSVRRRTPPWIVSRPAQRAALEALASPEYYAARYLETHVLRAELCDGLRALGWTVPTNGCANFVMAHPPIDATRLVDECATRKLFLRLVDAQTVRLAVRDQNTQNRMLDILAGVVTAHRHRMEASGGR